MSKITFPIPENLQETVSLLNKSNLWNLTIVEKEGYLIVLDGDQVQFMGTTPQEVQAFLAGCFLTTFNGESLEQIQTDFANQKFPVKWWQQPE